MSYGNAPTTFQFDKGTTLIRGTNGTGKTSLINALVYALYDKTISPIAKDSLINNINKKEMEVTVEFSSNGKRYRVRRFRKMPKIGNDIHIEEMNVDGNFVSIAPASPNNKIIEIIGMPYELFVRIVVFSTSHGSFFKMPSRHASQPNQSDFIEELFGLTLLTSKANSLKQVISCTEGDIKVAEGEIETIQRQHRQHQQQVDAAKNRIVDWEEQRQRDVRVLTQKLNMLETVDIEGQRTIHETVRELTTTKNEILRAIQSTQKDISILDKSKDDTLRELEALEASTCPYCRQSYHDERKLYECKDTINQVTIELDHSTNVQTELQTHLHEITEELNNYKNQVTVDNIEELIELKAQSAALQARVDSLKQANNPHEGTIDELEEMFNQLPQINYDKLNQLTKLLEHQKFLLKLLTKKDSFVRKALLNKNIPFLNERLQTYLKEMGLPHKVEFTHEMTAKITQFGRELDVGNLSKGQMARVDFALSVAFRDVRQMLHSKLNVWMLDEVLDEGLDGAGIVSAAKLLRRKAQDEDIAMYVISHREEVHGTFDRFVEIRFNQGFSELVTDQ